MEKLAMLIVLVILGAIGLILLIYLISEKHIRATYEQHKQKRIYKENRKILDFIYNDIMFKKTVLDEDEELEQISEKYPSLTSEIEEYREFRNTYFTPNITNNDTEDRQ